MTASVAYSTSAAEPPDDVTQAAVDTNGTRITWRYNANGELAVDGQAICLG